MGQRVIRSKNAMAVEIQDVVKANLVLVGLRLLNSPEQIERFGKAIRSDVQIAGAGLVANIASGLTEPGLTLGLNRDRITLDLSQSRSTVNREYPSRGDLSRLAEVAWQAIDNTDLTERPHLAFGFNIEMIFDQDSQPSAFGYLSAKLFDGQPLGNEGWNFVGGAGRLIFDDNGRSWTFNLEPRFNNPTESRVFLGGNLHFGRHPLPNETEIVGFLEEVWDKSHAFVERLDNKDDHEN